MKAYVLIICAVFLCNLAFGKVSKTDTGLYKQFTISFHKVTPSFEEANKAKLIAKYLDSAQLFNLRFVVPNYCYRYQTTPNDYFTIHTEKQSYRFANTIRALPENNDKLFYVMVIGKYIFETNIKSDALKEILSNSIQKVEFNFLPNNNIEEGVQKIRKNDKLDELEKHMISLSKRTIKVTIKDPEKNQLDFIKSFVEPAF